MINSEETLVGMFNWASSTLLLEVWRLIAGDKRPTLLHFHEVKLRKSMSQVKNDASLLVWAVVCGVKCRCGDSFSGRLLFVRCQNSLMVFLFLFNYRSVRNKRLVLALLLDTSLIGSLYLRLLIQVRLIADLHLIWFVEAT